MNQNNSRKTWKTILFAGFLAILAAGFFEGVVFQWNTLGGKDYEHFYILEDADSHSVSDDKKQNTYTFLTQSAYVKYFSVDYLGGEDFEYLLTVRKMNGYGQEKSEEIPCVTDGKVGHEASPVNGKAVRVNLIVSTEDIPRISGVWISNAKEFYPARFILIAMVVFCIVFLLGNTKFVAQHPEIVYVMAALSLGVVIILSASHGFDSWDEQIHYKNAVTVSQWGNQAVYTDRLMMHMGLEVPVGESLEQEQAIGQWLNGWQDKVVLRENKGRYIKCQLRAYIPQSIGLSIGNVLNLPYTWVIFLGKLGNLLFCVFVTACAIRYTRVGKMAIFCIGLLPTTLVLFSSFSYDGFVIALLSLGFGLFVTEFLEPGKMNWKRIFVGVLAITIGCFPKAVYIPLLALYWLLPKEKFFSRRQEVLFKISILLVILVMLSSFVLPVVSNVAAGAAVGGDYRGGDTSVSEQLKGIFAHPLNYTGILLSAIGETLLSYFFGSEVLTNFAYKEEYSGFGFYLIAGMLLFVFLSEYATCQSHIEINSENAADTGGETQSATGAADTGHKSRERFTAVSGKSVLWLKIGTIIFIFATMCLIWTALYLDFTPVGLEKINGVQPRYYIPLMYPLAMLAMNRTVQCHWKKQTYVTVIVLGMLIGSTFAIYYQQVCF